MSIASETNLAPAASVAEQARGWRAGAVLAALMLVSIISQVDRILPFILAESIRADLNLSDTQLGLVNGLAFAVCYTLLSLPLARAADRGSPRLVLLACLAAWSLMTALGGLAATFLALAVTRLGVAVGEAGAIPSGHALIARKIAPERRGLALGLFSMGIPLGTMIGFAGGGAWADTFGWRSALIGAGALGGLAALLVLLAIGPTPRLPRRAEDREPVLRAAMRLLSVDGFRWLFVGGLAIGFASAPFYAFSAPFLIRTHGFSASQVGLTFGLLQGLMGVAGTLLGGRGFDRAVRSGTGRVLGPPAWVFLASAFTTLAALFAPTGWLSILLFVPAMFAFAFLLPWAFGAAHLVAGPGRQALASSLVLIGSGLLGPSLGPLAVGMISDAAAGAGLARPLAFGLLLTPLASVLTGVACLIANRRIAAALNGR